MLSLQLLGDQIWKNKIFEIFITLKLNWSVFSSDRRDDANAEYYLIFKKRRSLSKSGGLLSK